MPPVGDSEAVVALLAEASDAAALALGAYHDAAAAGEDMRAKGARAGQYRIDLVVDAAVLEVLARSPYGVLSEESGLTEADSDVVVVVDPVDGSTNASRGFPWYACSLCAVDREGPWVALVANLATGVRHSAVRGEGAYRHGPDVAPEPIATSATDALVDSLVLLNGHPPAHLGWRQYRSLGATALDICAVADGSADATIDCTRDALGPWDYMAGALILQEAGGVIEDCWGRDLVVLEHDARRTPVSAANPQLLAAALDARGTG